MMSKWGMLCPACGKKAGKTSKYCGDCRSELVPAGAAPAGEVPVLTDDVLAVSTAPAEDDVVDSLDAEIHDDAETDDMDAVGDAVDDEPPTVDDPPAPAACVFRLVAVDGKLTGTAFDVPAGVPVVAGKDEGNAVCLRGDGMISSVHASFESRDGILVVEDLGSTNGTYVRRGPVNELRDGDEVLLGATTFRVSRVD